MSQAIVAGAWTTAVYLVAGWVALWLCNCLLRPVAPRMRAALLLLPLCFTGGSLIGGESMGGAHLAYLHQPLAAHQQDYGIEEPFNPLLTDVAGVVIPWHRAVREAYLSGSWPLWNRYAGCGEPLAASAQPAAFFPITLVALLVPLPQSFTLILALVFLTAATGAFVYARDLGCGELSGLLAAAGWAYCSYLVFWAALPHSPSAALLPLVLAATLRVVSRPGPGPAAVLGSVLALVVLAGHPESALHVVVLGAAVGIYELATLPSADRLPRQRRRAVAWAGVSGAAALLVAALYVLPVTDAILQSHQWGARANRAHEVHRTDPQHTRGALIGAVYPFAYGYAGRGTSEAKPVHLLMPGDSLYLGSVIFPFAAYGLWRGRSRRRWLLLGILLFAVLAGARTPYFFELLGRLPLFDVALNQRLVFAGSLCLAMLAGLGLEEVMRRRRRLAPALVIAVSFVVYGLGLLWLVPEMIANGVPRELIAGHSLAAAVPLAVLLLWLSTPRLLTTLPLLALVLLLGQRVAEIGWMYTPVASEAFYPEVPPLDKLPSRPDPYRVVGRGFTLIPNEATLYGLEDARTYNALHHRRFRETWPLWCTPELGFWFLRISDLGRPLLSFLNVEYAVVPRRVRRSPPWRRIGTGRRVKLWHNRRALPRAFVPLQVRLGYDDKATLRQMGKATDFGAVAWIDRGTVGDPREVSNGPGRVAVKREGTGYLLETNLERDAWVVVSETAWRGWRARSDGEELEVAFANHAFLGIRVPAGEQRVEVQYWPRSFAWGLRLSVVGVALLGSLALWARRRARDPATG